MNEYDALNNIVNNIVNMPTNHPIASATLCVIIPVFIACCICLVLICPPWKVNTVKPRTKHYKLADAERVDSLIDEINALRIDGYSIRKAAIKIAPDYEWLAWKMVDRVNKIENIYYYQTKARKNDASAKKNM